VRDLLLIVFVVQAVLEQLVHGDIIAATKTIIGLGVWTPSDLFVSVVVLVQILLALYAIRDGMRKDRERRERLFR
jgi:uncharacterized membrane protein